MIRMVSPSLPIRVWGDHFAFCDCRGILQGFQVAFSRWLRPWSLENGKGLSGRNSCHVKFENDDDGKNSGNSGFVSTNTASNV